MAEVFDEFELENFDKKCPEYETMNYNQLED